MTTLYREVRVETAEQAEALPEGAMAFRIRRDETGPLVARLCRFEGEPAMWTMTGEMHGYSSQHMVSWGGWTALVPTEAEEQFAVFVGIDGSMVAAHLPDGTPQHGTGSVVNLPRHRRYVTPWEEA